MIMVEDVPDGQEVAERFGHFLIANSDKAMMDPVVGKGFAVCPFALGDFIFMVGKDQVLAAAMDIEGLAEIFPAHGRAFDMPAGAARSPGTVPGRFAGF